MEKPKPQDDQPIEGAPPPTNPTPNSPPGIE